MPGRDRRGVEQVSRASARHRHRRRIIPFRRVEARLAGRRLRAEPMAVRRGRWNTTGCRFAPGRCSSSTTPPIRTTSSRCGTCSSTRPIRRPKSPKPTACFGSGGLLVINYPDIGSWIARVMGRSWVFLLDVHLYYFTRVTIRKLLEDAGFDVIRIRPHFQRLGFGYILHRATPYAGVAGASRQPARHAPGRQRAAGSVLDGTNVRDRAQALSYNTEHPYDINTEPIRFCSHGCTRSCPRRVAAVSAQAARFRLAAGVQRRHHPLRPVRSP